MKKKCSSQEMKLEKVLDKVEAAFKNMDKDGDGYIDWEEFKQVISSFFTANTIVELTIFGNRCFIG